MPSARRKPRNRPVALAVALRRSWSLPCSPALAHAGPQPTTPQGGPPRSRLRRVDRRLRGLRPNRRGPRLLDAGDRLHASGAALPEAISSRRISQRHPGRRQRRSGTSTSEADQPSSPRRGRHPRLSVLRSRIGFAVRDDGMNLRNRLVRIAAQVADRAAPAFGPARLADVAAVQDQPVVGVEPVLVRDQRLERHLRVERRLG